ncbi:MAG: AbrB/MazE/SpoVT family DNA-binding domain-containing protein [Chloroflexi bacterium]|nr:AbrB/MazE/SpoVT family DNA-binding domain-containing protein [Chloroflexota bacterium]
MVAHSKITRHGQITLPSSVREKVGIQEGDFVEIQVVAEKAVLKPNKMVDKSQAYFWTKRWQEAEREADKDIKTRRTKTFDTADELIRDLDKR